VLADPGGCSLEQVTRAGADEGRFQFHGPDPAGRRLLVGWYRGEETGAFVLDLVSGRQDTLAGFGNAGVFSPDGGRVLVANRLPDGNRELVELDLSTRATRIVAPARAAEFLATYGPDRSSILFNSYRTGRSDLYLIRPGQAEPVRLTRDERYDAHADWSPDGRSILFHREIARGDYDIYLLDLESGREQPLITGPGEQAYPAWSPDGRRIAFASDRDNEAGKVDLYLADPTGRLITRLTRHPGYNTYPAWSADGRWLYFNSERAGKRDVFRLDVEGCLEAIRPSP
jgi:TolB protein